jgi:hypothetical protein
VLRVVLTGAGGMIDTHRFGYLIRVGLDELDALVLERARVASDYRSALGLWRWPA